MYIYINNINIYNTNIMIPFTITFYHLFKNYDKSIIKTIQNYTKLFYAWICYNKHIIYIYYFIISL